MQFTDTLESNLRESIAATRSFLLRKDQIEAFGRIVALVVAAYKTGGRLFVAGNGGSAADAQHLAAEFVSKLARDRKPLPAEALTTDSSILTAIGNDYGFELIFARQVEGKMRPNDIFLGITTSGRSANINKALESCRDLGFTSVIFGGRDGGDSAVLADYCVLASGTRTSTIQEQHILLAHSLCECVESELFG
jgi:D-sedoheptulose 7-phosphate isomerase